MLECIAVNALVCFLMTLASRANYPGGSALTLFNELFDAYPQGSQPFLIDTYALLICKFTLVHVHVDNLAAQTGASLFLQTHAPPYPSYFPVANDGLHNWIYNKTENLSPADLTAARHFTHLITSSPLDSFSIPQEWTKVDCVRAYDGFRVVPIGSSSLSTDKEHETGVRMGRMWEMIPVIDFVFTDKLCILERSVS